MRRIDLTPQVVQGHKDDEGRPAEIPVKDVLASWLYHAAMKSGNDVAAPFFKAFDTPVQQRTAAKILTKLDSAFAYVDLSDDQHDLVIRLSNDNPYRTTRQCVVLDRIDDALKLDEEASKEPAAALEAKDKEMRAAAEAEEKAEAEKRAAAKKAEAEKAKTDKK